MHDPLQQICPCVVPQVTQLLLVSHASAGSHEPPQHGWVLPPHGVQCGAPAPLTQVRLVLHEPAQQGWLLPPHATQWLVPSQVRLKPLHVWPGQHRSPAFMPHAMQLPPLHTVPSQHGVVPAALEQPAPSPKQETHVPAPAGELHA